MRVLLISYLVWQLLGGVGVAQGKCDPFTPLVRNGQLIPCEPSQPVPKLTGILSDADGNSMALINDAWVRIGDVVDGYRVAEIHREAVVLAHNGAHVIIQISGEGEANGTASDLSDRHRPTRDP